jgi:hypothetical protein
VICGGEMARYSGGVRLPLSEDEDEVVRPGQTVSETHLSQASTLTPKKEKPSGLRGLFKRRPKTSAAKDQSM